MREVFASIIGRRRMAAARSIALALLAPLLAAGCLADNPDFKAPPLDAAIAHNDLFGLCGALGAPCCQGARCIDGASVCTDGLCVPCGSACAKCGGPGQPCCDGAHCGAGGCCQSGLCVGSDEMCDGTRVCSDGFCYPCGGAGQPCCANRTCSDGGCCVFNHKCVAAGTVCGNGLGACLQGGCITCGAPSGPCCTLTDPTPPLCVGPATACIGTSQASATCQPCGGDSQPCCPGGSCADGGCCALGTCKRNGGECAPNATCKSGSCNGCGGAFQPCCAVEGGTHTCTAPFTLCDGTTCQPCGGKGQACCVDPNSPKHVICALPFDPTDVDPAKCKCK
jgi:hypothetical protein